MQKLKISLNRRFLVHEDGSPFYWFGDTAWELFHRSTREDAERYLEKRNAQRFSIIQAVVLAEENGIRTPNRYGHHPLIDEDPANAFCTGTFSLAPSVIPTVIIRFGKCMNPAVGKGLTFQSVFGTTPSTVPARITSGMLALFWKAGHSLLVFRTTL